MRVELLNELAALAPLVERLGRDWRSVHILVRASQAQLEGRFADAQRLADDARDMGSSATVCAWLGDAATARRIYDQLLPYEGLHAVGFANAPYEGLVALSLGQLARVMARDDDARRHLEESVRACEQLHALPHLALTRAELALVDGVDTATGRAQAQAALALARRLGMAPLAASVEGLLSFSRRVDEG